jgi:predicted RND superfamily exporter protein
MISSRSVRGNVGRILVVVFAVAAVLCAARLPRLRFDHNTRSLLQEDEEADAREGTLVSSFGSEDIVLVAWEADVLDAAAFAELAAISAELGRVRGLEETYSLASDFIRFPLGGDLRALSKEDLATPATREAAREALLAAAPYVGTIYSRALDVVAVAGTLKTGPREARERTIREIRAVAARHERPLRPVYVAGVTALAMDAGEFAVEDMKRIGAIALVVSVAVLLVLCRSIRETLLATAATALPPLFALACAIEFDLPVTALSAALFPVMAVVGITGSVHVLSAYGEARRAGMDAAAAAAVSSRRLRAPIVLSFVTTAAGFETLQTTGVPAFRAGGHVVALGMLFAIPVLLLGIPAALAWTKPTPRDRPSRLARPLLALATWAGRRNVAVALLSTLLCAASAAVLPLARLRVDVLQAFQPESRIARTYAFLEDRLTATIPVDAVLSANADAKEEAVLRDLDDFSRRAVEAGADNAMSLSTLVAFGRRASPIAMDEAGALVFLRTFFAPITKRFEDTGTRRYRVKMRVRDGSPPEVLDRFEALARQRTTGVMELTGLYVRAVGTTRALVRNFARSAVLMAGIVLATVALALRSLRLGLAAIVPNLLPPLGVFGVASLLRIPLDVSAVAVGAVSIGLAVDNTLHVAFRLAEERRKGVPLEAAVPRAVEAVGRALVLSTVVLAAGLACLALSAFLPTAHFGLFAGAATLVALPGDLVVFPAFVRLLRAL